MHLNAPILKKSIFSQELWSAVANPQLVGDAHLFRVEDLREKGGMSGNVRQHVPTIIGLEARLVSVVQTNTTPTFLGTRHDLS